MRKAALAAVMAAGLISRAATAQGIAGNDLRRAESLYEHTDYKGSLKILSDAQVRDARALSLMGRDYFMLGDFVKAGDYFQKAVDAEPNNSEYVHWLGRAWGRRAETASPFTAPMAASKARQFFERAVALNPRNQEALGDLFDYYLQAPGFLGGGVDKAAALAKKIAELDAAEGHFAQAQIADKQKQFDAAEQQLRSAIELAPRQVGRVLDLAKYLSRHGRVQESEAVFAQAEKIAPNSPKVMYSRARIYVEQHRNLDQARALLKKYMESNLTPDDAPREEAARLLKQASTGA